MATETGLVVANGKTYSLADMAHYMDYDEREMIHAGNDVDETAQSFWDRFAATYPESAQHITEITPSASF